MSFRIGVFGFAVSWERRNELSALSFRCRAWKMRLIFFRRKRNEK